MRKHKNKSTENNVWQIQEAKAKFSEVVHKANSDGFQVITRNGQRIAVIISNSEFEELRKPKMSLLEFFKSAPCQDVKLDIERSKDAPRDIDL